MKKVMLTKKQKSSRLIKPEDTGKGTSGGL